LSGGGLEAAEKPEWGADGVKGAGAPVVEDGRQPELVEPRPEEAPGPPDRKGADDGDREIPEGGDGEQR
jgi:hypothetical protein